MKASVSRLTYFITTGILLLALAITWDIMFAMNTSNERRDREMVSRLDAQRDVNNAQSELLRALTAAGTSDGQFTQASVKLLEDHHDRIAKAETQIELQAMDIAITSNHLAAAITRLATRPAAPTATARR
jgi:hypothetical protein